MSFCAPHHSQALECFTGEVQSQSEILRNAPHGWRSDSAILRSVL
jgi:hypothetical protein